MKLPCRLLCLAYSSLLIASPVLAEHQAATPDSQIGTPNQSAPTSDPNPNQFMSTAFDTNSLSAPGTKPWHLRAKFQELGADGKPHSANVKPGQAGGEATQQGSLEIWWAGPEQYKIHVDDPDFTGTIFRAGKEDFFTGPADPTPWLQYIDQMLPLHPVDRDVATESMPFTKKDQTIDGVTMQCYSRTPPKATSAIVVKNKVGTSTTSTGTPVYCFSGTPPELRVLQMFSVGDGSVVTQATYSGTILLHGHRLPQQTRFEIHGIPFADMNIEEADPTLGIEEAALKPPPDARPVPAQKLLVPGDVVAPVFIKGQKPKYPKEARKAGVEGTVLVRVVVARDGTVKDLQVMSGPIELQPAAIDAVSTWRFKPGTLNGQPVEQLTQINVVFGLNAP